MIKINKLTSIGVKDLRALTAGYTSSAKYEVSKTESHRRVQFTLELVPLDPPYVKRFGKDESLEDHYRQVLEQGLSLGAYDGNNLVGIAIAEARAWNKTLWVWEFHVASAHQGKGIGTQLMNALAKKAEAAGLRVMVCETQNTNLPAIEFYRKVGFEIDALDLSYYTNQDVPEGEVAIFMKRKLPS